MRRRSPAGLLAAALATVLACASAHAQATAGGASRLGSVEVSGSQRFASARIAAATGLSVGSQVTRDSLQEGADRLAKLGWFSAVDYRFSSGASGVNVEYQVKDAESVPVEFDNFVWLTDQEIKTALNGSGILFDGTAPLDGTILDAIAAQLANALDAKQVHVQVSHQLTQNPAGERIQDFQVEDADMRVSGVEFSDPLARADHGIQQALSGVVGKPYSRTRLELFEVEQIRPVYFAHAYLQVRFGEPSSRFAATPSQPIPETVVALLKIDAGPAFTWGGAQWSGNAALTSQNLDALVQLASGAPADGNSIQALWDRVSDAYAQRGYLDATLTPTTQFDVAVKRVHYTVAINEGIQYHMGQLVLTGLSTEGERRIRGAWKIAPGALFDQGVYQQFLTEGIQEALVGLPFHYEKIGRYLQKNPKSATVDVMIDFQ
ncbi:MAG: POTRA domain-containing protein [Candidatus Acidiferrales bacterium]